jgi:hypothetical protein
MMDENTVSGRRRSAQIVGMKDPISITFRSARKRDRAQAQAGHNGGVGRLPRTESICTSISISLFLLLRVFLPSHPVSPAWQS